VLGPKPTLGKISDHLLSRIRKLPRRNFGIIPLNHHFGGPSVPHHTTRTQMLLAPRCLRENEHNLISIENDDSEHTIEIRSVDVK
jgi:hypothetical protein